MIKNSTQRSWRGGAAAGGEVEDVDQEAEKEGSKRGQTPQAQEEAGGEVQQRVAERSGMWIGKVKKGVKRQTSRACEEAGGKVQQRVAERSGMWIGKVKKRGQKEGKRQFHVEGVK